MCWLVDICYIVIYLFVVQFLRHSVLTVTFINNRMVMMLSIGPVALRIGMWLSISSWREQIPMLWIRWLYCFTDPYHLYLSYYISYRLYVCLFSRASLSHYCYSCYPLYLNGQILYSQIWFRIKIQLVTTSLNIIKMRCWSKCR